MFDVLDQKFSYAGWLLEKWSYYTLDEAHGSKKEAAPEKMKPFVSHSTQHALAARFAGRIYGIARECIRCINVASRAPTTEFVVFWVIMLF